MGSCISDLNLGSFKVSLSDWNLVDRQLKIYLKKCCLVQDQYTEYYGNFILVLFYPDQQEIITRLIRGKNWFYNPRITPEMTKPDEKILATFKAWDE